MPTLDVRPLRDDLPFGARIAGVTRATLADPAIRRQINAVFEDRGMIVFADVEQTGEMQVALSNVFGPLKDHPVKTVERVDADAMPGVITIRTSPEAGIVEIDGQQLMTWQPWHFDHSYNNELNRAGVLRGDVLPPEGGRTGFADGIQIYAAMDPALRAAIEGRDIIYTLILVYSLQRFGLPENFREVRSKGSGILEIAKTFPRALHPAVWARASGEKVLHISPYGARGIAGMETAEGDALFRRVWAETERAMTPYYHEWQPGDMLVWDNWRMLHAACGCDPKYERVMHRTTIKGDYGLGRWETEPGRLEEIAEMM